MIMIKKLKRIYENIYYKLMLLGLVKPRNICEELTRDLKRLKRKWKL